MRATIRFEPMGLVAEVPAGTSVLTAARSVEAPLGAACDGDGICGRCGVRVLSGRVPKESRMEQRSKAANRVDPTLRLACLIPARGDMVVTTDYW